MKRNFYKSRTLKPCLSNSFVLALTLMLTLFSCGKEDSKPSFSISGGSKELSIGPDELTENYAINTSGSWEIVPVEPLEWASISPMKGIGSSDFTLTINKNGTTEVRIAKFAFRIDGKFQSDLLSIVQEGIETEEDGDGDVELYLNVEGISENSLEIDSKEFEGTYFVRSNGAWTIDWDGTVDWISVSPTEGVGDGSITITAALNTEPEIRSVDLNFMREDGEITIIKLKQKEAEE